MLKGFHLIPGSTIGVVAPASCDDITIIKNNIKDFESLGFKMKFGSHLFDKYGYFAGKAIDRANDINNMFSDTSIDGILCLRGGYGSIQVLPYLNTDLIIKNPKFFCGFSDITILINYLCKLNLISFHGPMINSNFNDIATLNSLTNIIQSNKKYLYYDLSKLDNIKIINGRSFYGKLVGGNLSIICSAIGSKYEINTDNNILLIEEINELPYVIDRLLSQLIFSNKIQNCNGIICGHFKNCSLSNYDRSFTTEEVIINKLSNFNIPIIINFPFGHDYPNLTLPLGCSTEFNYKDLRLTFLDNLLD